MVNIGTNGEDLVDAERGQREGDQSGDAVAFLQVDLAFQGVTDLLDLAEEHTARAGTTVAVLALQFHVEEHLLLHFFHDLLFACARTSLLLGVVVDVGERSRVDIQGLHVDEDLVVPNLVHVVVQFVSGLRQHADGFDYTVSTVFVTMFLH